MQQRHPTAAAAATTKTTKTTKPRNQTRQQARLGKAAQARDAKVARAYRTMTYLGSLPRQPGWVEDVTLEGWRVPSTSEPGVSYTVAHDLARDTYHCDCPYGQHGGSGCVHELAARRAVWQRRVNYERDQRETHGYNDDYNLCDGTQATSEWE